MMTGSRMPDWMQGAAVRPQSKIMFLVCWLVRADPDILAGCPLVDRFQIIAKAVLLLAVAGIALFVWAVFLMLFVPWYAMPLLIGCGAAALRLARRLRSNP